MKRLYILIIILLSSSQILFCQKSKNIPPEKPKLIIGIVIDQMRYDYLTRFYDKLEVNGFKRFINEGTNCRYTYLNYMYTQTGPGHATIFTGTTPSMHGIVTNEWYIPLKKQKVYCVDDSKVSTVGSNSNNGKFSPQNMMTPTFGDQLRLHNQNRSKVIAISLKDRAAILPGGKTANAAYWYDDATGNFITSSYYMNQLPKWLQDFNSKKLAETYLNRLWTPLLPIQEYTESLRDSNKYEQGFGNGQFVFPYDLKYISTKNKKEIDYAVLKYTPFGNTILNDLAKAVILNEEMGKDNVTDFLIISFSATDYIGHRFGPRSIELQDTYLRLDKELVHLLDFIENEIGKENVLIFLTSDHGVGDHPSFLTDQKLNGGIFKQYLALSLLRTYLNATYGEGDWVLGYADLQFFLNRNLIEDAKLSLKEVQEKVASFLLQFNGVANAVTSYSLQYQNYTDGILNCLQKSFHPKRSGDVLIALDPGWIEDSSYMYDHNSCYTYDTHVPLMWYGWKIPKMTIHRRVNIIDIVPTLAAFLQIEVPMGCTGIPIQELLGN
ncbi:MAG: alkaline phosphatase family protein [Bacteroidales bacterium]|nr:alkaline phosphatase family protein [Bacteroidales bacterium]